MIKKLQNKLVLILLLFGLSLGINQVQAQTFNFASHLSSTGSITGASNAGDEDIATFATLRSAPGAIGFSLYTGRVDMEFPTTISAVTPVYIVLSQTGTNSFLRGLLGGTLGGVVADLAGVVFGDPQFRIDFRNASGTSLSNHVFQSGSAANIEIGEDGLMYLKLNAPANTRRVSVLLSNPALLGIGGSEVALNVHDAFYFSGTTPACESWLTTKYDVSGISLTLLSSNPEPVLNAHYAIDDDPETFSNIGYNTFAGVYVGSTIYQDIYFNSVSATNEEVVISFEQAGSLLNLDLLKSIRIEVRNGSTLVFNDSASTLLTLDALNIISLKLGAIPDKLSIPVTGVFDRVRISYTQGINLGVMDAPLRLFDVYKAPVKPILSDYDLDVCGGLSQTISVTNVLPGISYKWLDANLTEIHTGNNLSYEAPADGVSDTLFVYAVDDCGKQSAYQPFVVNGNDAECISSVVAGNVDVSMYSTSNPLNAVITGEDDIAQQVEAVNITTGDYQFDAVTKGDYLIKIANYAVAPGDAVAASSVDEDYSINNVFLPLSIKGDGVPESSLNFIIDFAPLNLEWKRHNAQQVNNVIVLDWEVTNGDGLEYFTINRSKNGKDFEKIGTVRNNEALSYKYEDGDVLPGNYYYQILMNQTNGKQLSSPILPVALQFAMDNYIVYPSSFSNTLNIKNLLGGEIVTVTDIMGRSVMQTSVEAGMATLQFSDMVSGTYFVIIKNQEGKESTFKVVKQ